MPPANDLQVFQRSARLMGNQFSFSVVAAGAPFAHTCLNAAVAEVQRIEALLTTFNEESETAAINRMAGVAPVRVSAEVFALIERSLKLSALTQGAFDITYGGLDKSLWNFDTGLKALPDGETAKRMVRLIDYRKVRLDAAAQTVMLQEQGMRIGFGGIGKGYAADKVKALLQGMGVESGVVNASGDLVTWGSRPGGEGWTIGIADPAHRLQPFSALDISNRAVATSGNYEKFVVIDGKRYSHTIDPKTGLPVCGPKSVTIICNSAELADALATPVMVMGLGVGLHLINQLPGVGCVAIDEEGRLATSKNIKIKNP